MMAGRPCPAPWPRPVSRTLVQSDNTVDPRNLTPGQALTWIARLNAIRSAMVIDLPSRLRHPLSRQLYKAAAPLLERGLHIRSFNEVYERTRRAYLDDPAGPSPQAWFGAAMRELDVHCETRLPEGFQMPSGPVIVVANHPFGLLDPLILGDFLAKQRTDLRLMANFLLDGLEELQPWIVPVDPFHAGSDSARRNLKPMKESLRHLRGGGVLGVFPSGEVAHWQPGKGIAESPWSHHIGALARRAEATVLPVFFKGRNSVLFHTAGLVHPRLRTGLLLRELFDRSRHPAEIRVGRPIPHSRYKHFEDDAALTRYLRLHTLILGQDRKRRTLTVPVPAPLRKWIPQNPLRRKSSGPAQECENPSAIQAEVAALESHALASQGPLAVYMASAFQIPTLLREIGRQREITFRLVGEGTGQALDLDRFDRDYLHLFLWDHSARQLAGAYRIGRCDQLLRQHGARGLYTNTLFKYQKPFLDGLHNALELGRSFIIPAWQRNPSALQLLWKGVCRWVARHPQYRRLFGPVSISQDYHDISRRLMVDFFGDHRSHPHLAAFIKPRQPYQRQAREPEILREFVSANLREVDDFSAVISSLETDGKGIPVLLKHYLRLNATLLSFNVDKAFNNCLDGLIHVDLADTNPKLLGKYMGGEACQEYLARHQFRN